MARPNVIPCGIEPRSSGLEKEILQSASQLSRLFHELAAEALTRLRDAEADCLRRLDEYVPTDRPLTVEEAAAYLGMTRRALNDGTRPGMNPVVPFLIVNGKKLFRKCSLDKSLADREIKREAVKL